MCAISGFLAKGSTMRSVAMHALSSVAFGLAIFSGPANAGPLVADGISYLLTEATTADPLTDQFTLTISGINAPNVPPGTGDAEGGRSGFNAVAFSTDGITFSSASFESGTSGTVAASFAEQSGGLSNKGGSGGCDGTGTSFFCFAGIEEPTGTTLAANSSLQFVFDVTVSSGDFTTWDPHFKINWLGTNNNYDLVSLAIPVNGTPPSCTPPCSHIAVPEPRSLTLLGGGLIGLGFVAFLRRRRDDECNASA
jgi:hypothetical protein